MSTGWRSQVVVTVIIDVDAPFNVDHTAPIIVCVTVPVVAAPVVMVIVDRPAAIRRARRCLDEMVIEGIRTNIPFLRRIINNPDFIKGDFDTGFVGRLLAERASAA